MVDLRRILARLAVFSLLLVACGDAPEATVETTRVPEDATTTIAPIDLEPEERIALASEAITNVDTFRYRALLDIVGDPEIAFISEVRIEVEGSVDVPANRSYLRIDSGDLWTDGDDTVPSFSEEIRIDGVVYERGFGTLALFLDEPDWDAWYIAPTGGSSASQAIVDVVEGQQVADLLESAETLTEIDVETRNGIATTGLRGTISAAALRDLAERYPGSILDINIGSEGPETRIEAWIDDSGVPHQLILEAAFPEQGLISYVIDLEFFDFGQPVEIEAPPNPIEPPDDLDSTWFEPETVVDDTTRIRPESDGTMFRLNVFDGDAVLQLTVEENGRVVAVTDTSVLATPRNYTTWRISDAAVGELVALIEAGGLLDHPEANLQFGPDTDGLENSASIFYNECCVLGMDGLGRRDGFTDEQLVSRLEFERIVELLRTHRDWLGDEVMSEPEPFVPEGLTLQASRVETTWREPVPWPLEEAIEALAIDPSDDAGGVWQGLPVCLYGDEAAAVFALTDQGTSLTFDDGTGLWDVFVRVHLPGYRLYGDPCP